MIPLLCVVPTFLGIHDFEHFPSNYFGISLGFPPNFQNSSLDSIAVSNFLYWEHNLFLSSQF
ncbi:unnamed protein product [Meloidogyne enterolobii]|uniref:Uncharacterized protein n=1 Tax=Meloidogyne enterolobii TaxID=390850 RepID=A0ACB1AD59_MELEN